MASESPPNKRKYGKYLFMVIFAMIPLSLFVILFLLNVPAYRIYPYEVSERWICNEPYFSLTYVQEDGAIRCIDELEWEDQKMSVALGYRGSLFWVFPTGPARSYENRLLSGTWKYRKGNLVLVIEEDFLFDHQYSELVFSPVSMDSQAQPAP